MLNPESRKYFQRAFASSGVALIYFVVRKSSHVHTLQECTGIQDPKALLGYLQIADADTLRRCSPDIVKGGSLLNSWVPSVERKNINRPFLTKTPEEIYDANEVPAMDTMFTFNTQVL